MSTQEPQLPQKPLIAFDSISLGPDETQQSIARALLAGTFPWTSADAINHVADILAKQMQSDLRRDHVDRLLPELLAEVMKTLGRPQV